MYMYTTYAHMPLLGYRRSYLNGAHQLDGDCAIAHTRRTHTQEEREGNQNEKKKK